MPLVLLLLFGHWAYWYRARVRPAAPNPADLPAHILLDGDFPIAVWIPYPHQNLGALSRLGSSPQELSAALAKLAKVEAPVLPRFGPYAAPPAREMVLAADPAEGRFLVAARIYPGLAVVARLAGRMAGNPWLGGGTIVLRGGPVEIGWEGNLWSARTADVAPLPPVPSAVLTLPPGLEGRALGVGRTAMRETFLPEGFYRLAVEGGEGHLRLLPPPERDQPAAPDRPGEGELRDLFLEPLLSETVTMVAVQDRADDGQRGLALFGGADPGNGQGTGFALLSANPARQLPLTGMGLAALVGDRGYSGVAAGWSLLATSELSFRQGAFLVPAVREGLEGHRQRGEPLELALAGRPGPVLDVLRELSERLAAQGPVAQGERRRLLAFRDLLKPLREFSLLRLAVSADRRTVRLELVPEPSTAGQGD